MSTIQTIAKLAKMATKNSKDVETLIETAGAVVTAAKALIEEAKPILDEVDTDALAAKVRTGAKSAAEGAGKAGNAVKNAAGDAAGTVSTALSKLGDAKDGIMRDLYEAKSEKELRRAIKEARQSVLENATIKTTVSDLQKAAEKTAGAMVGPLNDVPGCFVIATYRKLDFDNDLTDYTGIFVGKADDVSDGVFSAISRAGDPDVYADVKFKQNVHVYVYNCRAEDLDERFDSLLQTFADDRLYGQR